VVTNGSLGMDEPSTGFHAHLPLREGRWRDAKQAVR
jgi:hypothetical protein